MKDILVPLPEDGWIRITAGDRAKGLCGYDWGCRPLSGPVELDRRGWLLVRRSVTRLIDLRAFVIYARQDIPLEEVVRVAGTHWSVEGCFEAAKGEVGLDHHEVRSWTGWYRHITLTPQALALLVVLRGVPSHPAEYPGDTAPPVAVGAGPPADRPALPGLVFLARVASAHRQVLLL
jgi:hypothetical protein